MDILRLDDGNRTAIRQAVRVLQKGGVVIYPTETSYGVAADAASAKAVALVRRIKGRGAKPMAVIVADRRMVTRWFVLERIGRCLADHFWPGPLTIILPIKDQRLRRSRLTAGAQVGVRVSAHPVARALSRGLGRPIVATSANRSGQDNCYSLAEFILQFRGRRMADVFLDGGTLPKHSPSTIVAIEDGDIRVLRRGAIRLSRSVCSNVLPK